MGDPISRPHYSKLLEDYQGTPQIKVLSGVRRCGKSTLLEMLLERLRKTVPVENTFFLRCDSSQVPMDATADWLEREVQLVLKQADNSQKIFLLFDEVQEIPGWEKVIRRLHTNKQTDIYVTGSNAFLLSSDLATYLSGRYVEIPIFPLSFQEYLDFSAQQKEALQKDELFDRYLRYGGMPGLFELRDFNPAAIQRELQAIHDTVILNDVAKRFEIRDIGLLEKLVRYVFSTSGNLFPTRNIVNTLSSAGRKVYFETIESYLDGLVRAYLIYPCEQEGLRGKEVLRPLRKFYAPDTGLRNLEIGFALQDIGYQLESIVRIELARRGYKVAVGSLASSEVDFVARSAEERIYIQVAQSLGDSAVMERELQPLRMLSDSHPKVVLTTDRVGLGTTPDGIQVKNIVDWLLED